MLQHLRSYPTLNVLLVQIISRSHLGVVRPEHHDTETPPGRNARNRSGSLGSDPVCSAAEPLISAEPLGGFRPHRRAWPGPGADLTGGRGPGQERTSHEGVARARSGPHTRAWPGPGADLTRGRGPGQERTSQEGVARARSEAPSLHRALSG
ncbi:unnamed protein product [Arctogadus glacialis]